ncbi:MAG: Flp family type IVb pilin, partial [Bryobacteraceae bacterium]
ANPREKERRDDMKNLMKLAVRLQIWKDTKGQDLIEYALMAGFVAVAAGAVLPNISTQISIIFQKVNSLLVQAAAS